MAWTKEQEKAIFQRGSNILVSAGAGSGKTAVLSERILEYCKSGNDIRKILVLTFTKAAALEMKERIRKKLLENELYQQADYIDAAYITTFDSYSLSLVKKYYYKLGISKNISIMDQAMVEMKRIQIIDELFKEYYDNNNQEFLSFLSKYTKQDDKEITGIVIDLCKKLDLIIDTDYYIDNYEKEYFSKEKIIKIADDYEFYASNIVEEFKVILKSLLDVASLDSASIKMYDSLLELYNNLNLKNSYIDLYNLFNGYSLPRTSPKADIHVKEAKELLSNSLKQVKDVFSKYAFKEDMISEILSTKDDIIFLLKTCKEVINRLLDCKNSVGLYDFNDIAKLAIKLVYNHNDIKEELKNYYNEILVDEYQDTSDMQEYFLSAIENNNRYMVGDIKQSIYRFRNANPYIFKRKYELFGNGIGGEKIDLTYNFRSRKEVLNNINTLFIKLMTNTFGDADYASTHQMIYGQTNYEGIEQKINYDLDVLSYSSDDIDEFSKEEIEAFIIAKNIKEIINSKAKVLKGKEFKEVSYNDFAILIDKAKSFVVFKQIFEDLGIPLSIEADLDLKDSILPKLFSNILILIQREKNKLYDKMYYHAKASICRSFIYEMNDEDIFKIVLYKEESRIDFDIKTLAQLKEISYSSLFFKICEILDIYNKLSLIGNVDNSIIVLEAIHNLMSSLDSTSSSLDEAVEYFEKLFESDIKLSYTLKEGNNNSVRIMTIHKSKGLEFAYCYFPLLSSSFNKQDEKASIGLDKKYGVYIPYADEGKSNTIIKPLVARNIRQADISERIRLLYVALTRAREKMILVMDQKEYNSIDPKSFKSFHEMISYANVFGNFVSEIDLNDYGITKNYKIKKHVDNGNLGSKKIDYLYQIDIKELEKSRISKLLNTMISEDERRILEFGTRLHEILEIIDFENPQIDELPITSFEKDTIKKVLNLEIFRNIKNAKVYREHEFYYNEGNEFYHGIIDLLVEYEDHVEILDYKLFNINSLDYNRQLEAYRRYVKSISQKKLKTYLISLLKLEVLEI